MSRPQIPFLNRRLEGLGTTIFAEMSARAVATGSINLGQGFPDRDGPAEIAQAAADAILAGRGNQYPPGPGVPELRQAIASKTARDSGYAVDRNDDTALSISFPRFGSGRATDIPIYTYGLHKNAHGKDIPQKTLISRSASGQGEQIAGNVPLTLGDKTQKGCVCKLGPPGVKQACVCLMLRELGLPRPPDANGWLEHMSAYCSAAMATK